MATRRPFKDEHPFGEWENRLAGLPGRVERGQVGPGGRAARVTREEWDEKKLGARAHGRLAW